MKVFTGKVIRTKMAKTATVAVERLVAHPIYKKRMAKTKLFHAHDELGVKVGDTVIIRDIKPVSKLKKWGVVEVVKTQKEKKAK